MSEPWKDLGNARPRVRAGKTIWTQFIRDRRTDEILAEYPDGRHLSPMAVDDRWPNGSVRVSYSNAR